jgi:uncharacterized membrane protein YeaQ/YmgE (transglycosylase-associated protein family)
LPILCGFDPAPVPHPESFWHGSRTGHGGQFFVLVVRGRKRKEGEMGLIAWIVLGLVAGALAKWIMPGRDPGGCIVTIVIGVVGALLGGFLSTLLGFGGLTGSLDWRSLIIAVLGSLVLLAVWRMLRGRRA